MTQSARIPAASVPWPAAQMYQFDAALVAPGASIQSCGFTVLAGETGPRPTGGGGIVQVINRARRLGYTINTGFNPQSIDVPIRFYDPGHYAGWPVAGVINGNGVRQSVEDQIKMLEWMWGFGALYKDGHPATGDIPTVQVTSFNAVGTRTALMPDNWRSDQDRPGALRWQISNVQYGTAYSHSNGSRWFQDAVVSLIQQVATPGDLVPTVSRQTSRGTRSDATKVVSTSTLNTVSKICVKHGYASARSHTDVLLYNQQNVAGSKLKGKGLHTALRAGTVVYLPVLSAAVKKAQKKR